MGKYFAEYIQQCVHTLPSKVSGIVFLRYGCFLKQCFAKDSLGGQSLLSVCLSQVKLPLKKNKTKQKKTHRVTYTTGIDFSQFWRLESQDQGIADQGIGESFPPDFQMAAFSLCSHMAERERERERERAHALSAVS